MRVHHRVGPLRRAQGAAGLRFRNLHVDLVRPPLYFAVEQRQESFGPACAAGMGNPAACKSVGVMSIWLVNSGTLSERLNPGP